MQKKHSYGGYTKKRYYEIYGSIPAKKKQKIYEHAKQIIFPIEQFSHRKGLVQRTCPICGKQFAIYKSKVKRNNRTYCSQRCYKFKQNEVLSLAAKLTMKSKKKTYAQVSAAKAILKEKGFYKANKDSFKEKIIPYADSPSGKAYVGINKEPFMPAADKGYGFQGVLIQDDNRMLVQCHSCGKWCKKITTWHTQQCGKMTTDQYKKKYGLNRDRGLVSDETSLRLTRACLNNKDNDHLYARMKGKKGKYGRKGDKHTIEFFNRHGTCPLQLKTRLYEFIRCNRELPSQGNRGRSIYKALRKRFGSYGHALQVHRLPFMKRKGTTLKFVFEDGTIYSYNLNKLHDREDLYSMMMQKCPVLTSSRI